VLAYVIDRWSGVVALEMLIAVALVALVFRSTKPGAMLRVASIHRWMLIN
jgi:hypothetical protein